jgi:hypothetical protein
MQRRIVAAFAALVTAGLLAIASPASAAAPAYCGPQWTPTNGSTVVSVVGNRVTLDLSFTLNPNELGAVKCVSSFVRLVYAVDNAGAANNLYDYSTTLPYSSYQNQKAPKYQPLTGQFVAGAAAVNTYLLVAGRTYTMTVAWKTTAGPATFRLTWYAFNLKTGLFGCTNPVSPLCQTQVDKRQLYSTAKPVASGVYMLGT